jgi:hypothetical protein
MSANIARPGLKTNVKKLQLLPRNSTFISITFRVLPLFGN